MNRRLAAVAVTVAVLVATTGTARAQATKPAYAPIFGSGSSWAANALSTWSSTLHGVGLQVDYAATGSARGRADFASQQADFAVSDLTWAQAGEPQTAPPVGSFAYVPLTAGAIAFTYNVQVGGVRRTDIRLSGSTLAGIFSGRIRNWNDPAITADNHGRRVSDSLKIIPVIRSDGSAPSYHLTDFFSTEYPDAWTPFSTDGATAYFPDAGGRTQAKAGSEGVVNYIRQPYANGAIGYVEPTYAANAALPVVAVGNVSRHFIPPQPANVSLALLAARADATGQVDLHPVFENPDPRAYPLSFHSYAIVATKPNPRTTPGAVQATVDFLGYALCNGQAGLSALGYAPLPVNLTKVALRAAAELAGADRTVDTGSLAVAGCGNPTIKHRADGSSTDKLRHTVPAPPACSAYDADPCRTG